MTAMLILGLFTVFQESGSPPVAADTGMIHGVLVDTKARGSRLHGCSLF